MSRDGRELVVLLVSGALLPLLCWGVLVLDERRLDPPRLARAWPAVSRTAAVLAFGPLAVVLHFARTRGSFRSATDVLRKLLGLALGLVLAALVVVAASFVIEVLADALAPAAFR